MLLGGISKRKNMDENWLDKLLINDFWCETFAWWDKDGDGLWISDTEDEIFLSNREVDALVKFILNSKKPS